MPDTRLEFTQGYVNQLPETLTMEWLLNGCTPEKLHYTEQDFEPPVDIELTTDNG